jgi:hypothetical protein
MLFLLVANIDINHPTSIIQHQSSNIHAHPLQHDTHHSRLPLVRRSALHHSRNRISNLSKNSRGPPELAPQCRISLPVRRLPARRIISVRSPQSQQPPGVSPGLTIRGYHSLIPDTRESRLMTPPSAPSGPQ